MRLFDIKYGGSRTVILIGKYAIKIPNGILSCWTQRGKRICEGWFNNCWEIEANEYYKDCFPVCPLLHVWLCGLILVFERCEEITKDEFDTIKWWTFSNRFLELTEVQNQDFNYPMSKNQFKYDCHQRKNVGKLNGRIVAVDLGFPQRAFSYQE